MTHHRLTLIGFRASGKSTVGRLVAAQLAWPFVDGDTITEQQLGCSISHAIAEQGEPFFRQAEHIALVQALTHPGPMVLATGGGVVLARENRELLRQFGGLIVYLATPLVDIQDRLTRNSGGRPSLTGLPVAEEAAHLLAQRDPLYREIAQVVFVPQGPPLATALDVVKALEKT